MRKKIFLIGAAACSVVVMMVVLPSFVIIGLFFSPPADAQSCSSSNVVIASTQLGPDQLSIAKIIIGTTAALGRKAGLSAADAIKAEVISVATGFGESSLKNVMHGDIAGPDSIGVFQQRTGWGPLAVRTNPALATGLFLTVNKGPGVTGLFNTPGWQQMTVTQAAHAVQHNADPSYYAQFQSMATNLVDQANGGNSAHAMLTTNCTSAGAPGSSSGGTSPGGLVWPVLKSGSSVSSCYGPRVLGGVSGFHPGVDIAQAHGAPVYAATSGTITIAGPVSGYGSNYVSIVSDNGKFFTGYGHMSAKSVTVGQKVTQGQQIGAVGNEGASTGDHLHFNYIRSDLPHDPYNGNVDPLKNGLSIPAGIGNPNGCS